LRFIRLSCVTTAFGQEDGQKTTANRGTKTGVKEKQRKEETEIRR
jgi:hypothetical protein